MFLIYSQRCGNITQSDLECVRFPQKKKPIPISDPPPCCGLFFEPYQLSVRGVFIMMLMIYLSTPADCLLLSWPAHGRSRGQILSPLRRHSPALRLYSTLGWV